MEVRGHWQPVDTDQIYATCTDTQTHTHPCKHICSHSPVFGAARYSSGFLLLLIFGSFQLQIPEPQLFSAPLRDPPNWERLWLRELNRHREGEQILVWKWKKKVRTKEWANERSKELDLCRPMLIKWRMAVCSTVGLMKAEPPSSTSSSLAKSQIQPSTM